MFWSEIRFMLFPNPICPACGARRAISRSIYLCSTCEDKAHAFISERKRHAQFASSPVEPVDSSMKGAF